MLFATIKNTSSVDYNQNDVSIGAGETLYVAPQHIANMKLDSEGYIYHIDLGHTVHNPWSTTGHSNVPRNIPGLDGHSGLLLTVWFADTHRYYGQRAFVSN